MLDLSKVTIGVKVDKTNAAKEDNQFITPYLIQNSVAAILADLASSQNINLIKPGNIGIMESIVLVPKWTQRKFFISIRLAKNRRNRLMGTRIFGLSIMIVLCGKVIL